MILLLFMLYNMFHFNALVSWHLVTEFAVCYRGTKFGSYFSRWPSAKNSSIYSSDMYPALSKHPRNLVSHSESNLVVLSK